MVKKAVTAYVETDVEVDLYDFDTSDIIDFLENDGYTVCKSSPLDKQIWQLYLTYISSVGAGHKMDKELGNFFADYFNKVKV